MKALAHTIAVGVVILLAACSQPWTMYRHDVRRSGGQSHSSNLSKPSRVPTLAIRWTFTVPATDTVAGLNSGFRASPIVYHDRVYVGSGNGRLYALDAMTGAVLWKYPAPPAPPLRSQFMCNPSSFG